MSDHLESYASYICERKRFERAFVVGPFLDATRVLAAMKEDGWYETNFAFFHDPATHGVDRNRFQAEMERQIP